MMKQLFLTILFVFCYFEASLTQTTASIKGKVIDKTTGTPLSSSNIVIIGTNYGAAAADDGSFFIDHLPPGTYSIEASRINYQPQVKHNIQLRAGKKSEIIFKLTPRILKMAPIEIEADKFSLKYQTEVSKIGFQKISPRQIKHIPGTFDDISRAVQIFGSVMPASDYNSYFAVRGGSPEQNLVVMDGTVIPNPYRLRLLMGGGLSIFDPNITEDVRLHIGGFSAEFGNFLSSVLEVDTREGNRHRICGRGSLNLIDASGVLEGPIMNGRGSWLIAGRRTFYDLLANRFAKENSTYPNTYDLNGKFVFNVDERNKLSLRTMLCVESTNMLSQLSGELNINEDSRIQLISLNWLNSISQKMTRRTSLAYYLEDFKLKLYKPELFGYVETNADFVSDIKTFSISEDVIYEWSKAVWMSGGFYYSTMWTDLDFARPNLTLAFSRRDLPPSMKLNETENYLAFYTDNIFKLKDFFHLKTGLRYDYSDLIDKSALSPRLSLWLRLSENLSLEGFWGMCSQNPNILSSFIRNETVDLSANLDQLVPEKTNHFTTGFSYKISNSIYSKIEFYYKTLNQLIFAENQNDLKPANIGKGFSRGFEFYIQKEADSKDWFSGILSYSYGLSRYIETVHNVWLPFSFDRRHSLSFLCNIKLSGNLKINLLWRAASGLPYKPKYGLLITSLGKSFLENENFKKYFPPYQRFDIRLNYEHRRGDRTFSMYIDITNVYNHRNVYDQIWQVSKLEDYNSPFRIVKMRTVYMLPIVPSFGLSYQF